MTKARDRFVLRRLRAGLGRDKPRPTAILYEGRVLRGQTSTHKLPSGRLYNLRLRLRRRFHTPPLLTELDE